MKRYYLSITSWAGLAPGAVHYFGRIKGEYTKIIPRPKAGLDFTREDYDVENEHKDEEGWTTRFYKKTSVIKAAIKTFQRLKLRGMLYLGSEGTCQPQRVLMAPKSVMEKAKIENALWREQEKLYKLSDDPWKAGYGKQMNKINAKWQKLWVLAYN